MIKPLVLSRQPCMTPGAGHTFGNGLGGNGGGGGGVDGGPGANSGGVENGCETALSKRAQPDSRTVAAQTTATVGRDGRIRMPSGYGSRGGIRHHARRAASILR
jgi:hypothetical protein